MAALTTDEIDALPTYTNAQLLKLIDFQIASILAGGQRYSVNERNMEKAKLDDLFKRRAELVAAVEEEEATDDVGGIVLVQYGERV
jgi:hypothetical protein